MGGCMTVLLRTFRRFRDMYVSCLGGCAGSGGGGGGGGTATTGVTAGLGSMMSRARSSSAFAQNSNHSADEDFKELVRVNSKQLDPEAAIRTRTPVAVMPRSQSVAAAIGRIDEEAPCEFDDGSDFKLGIPMPEAYSRSRSCAVVPTGRNTMRIGGV